MIIKAPVDIAAKHSASQAHRAKCMSSQPCPDPSTYSTLLVLDLPPDIWFWFSALPYLPYLTHLGSLLTSSLPQTQLSWFFPRQTHLPDFKAWFSLLGNASSCCSSPIYSCYFPVTTSLPQFWINLLPIRKGLSASQEILREPLLCQPSPYDHLALIKSSALLLCYKSITEIPWWCCLPAHYLHNLFICSYIVTLRSSSMIPLTYDHLSEIESW